MNTSITPPMQRVAHRAVRRIEIMFLAMNPREHHADLLQEVLTAVWCHWEKGERYAYTCGLHEGIEYYLRWNGIKAHRPCAFPPTSACKTLDAIKETEITPDGRSAERTLTQQQQAHLTTGLYHAKCTWLLTQQRKQRLDTQRVHQSVKNWVAVAGMLYAGYNHYAIMHELHLTEPALYHVRQCLRQFLSDVPPFPTLNEDAPDHTGGVA